MNTLSADLTQLTEPNSTTRPGVADAADVRQQLTGKHVCPFCGVIRADVLQPCPRCTMEDSSATRSATRQRIGPWFVLQARNPSAPGMRYVTLLSLVRKGHVTPRSIVRGPTTHQLWTFAASVRGLSREFGICYHCGEQIDAAAPNCPHCIKSQDLPADPDVWLEPVPEMAVSAGPASSETGMDGGTSLDLQADHFPEETPRPAPAVPKPAPPIAPGLPAIASQRTSRPTAPSALATRQAVDRVSNKEEQILSARELAAAFQLDFKPPGQPGGKRFGFFKTAITLLLIGGVGTGIVMFLRPELREQSTDWLSAKWTALRAQLDKPATVGTTPIPKSGSPGAAAPTIAAPKSKPAPVAVAPAPEVKPSPAPDVKPAPVPTLPPAPRPVVEQPAAVIPAPAGVDVTPSDDVVIPDNLTPEQARDLGQTLRKRGLVAADKGDWRMALHMYQQIQRLPREAWPSDLQVKLDVAKKRAG